MNPSRAEGLRALLKNQQIAALGTLHQGEPFVSMTPFAFLPAEKGFVLHVSGLASHTQDMLSDPAVSLLIVAPPAAGVPPQAVARATVQGTARRCGEDDPDYPEARQAYLARFPESAEMFDFSDFSLFVVVPRSVRFVGGFAQATTLTAKTLATILADAP
jgi:putative heme iron utilization protein